MKKQKTVKPFFFKNLSHQDMVDVVNTDLSINLKYNEDLVNRVYNRYPLIPKTDVIKTITAIFSSLRDLLILGKVLNFNTLFFDTKLFFFDYKRFGAIFPTVKVKISTPPPLKKNNE